MERKVKKDKNDHILLIRHLMLGVNTGWQFSNTAVEHHSDNASDFYDPWPLWCFSSFFPNKSFLEPSEAWSVWGVPSQIALQQSEQLVGFGFIILKNNKENLKTKFGRRGSQIFTIW